MSSRKSQYFAINFTVNWQQLLSFQLQTSYNLRKARAVGKQPRTLRVERRGGEEQKGYNQNSHSSVVHNNKFCLFTPYNNTIINFIKTTTMTSHPTPLPHCIYCMQPTTPESFSLFPRDVIRLQKQISPLPYIIGQVIVGLCGADTNSDVRGWECAREIQYVDTTGLLKSSLYIVYAKSTAVFAVIYPFKNIYLYLKNLCCTVFFVVLQNISFTSSQSLV